MPSPKDRQNSGISMQGKDRATVHLNEALEALYANLGPSPVMTSIRAAMAELGIKEAPPEGPAT